jgi:CDP-2,3-bis-(O-geranylgeranyl)-sn-glycerol synthase
MNVLLAFYLMVPAYVANMAPPLVFKFFRLKAPMDFGLSFGGVRILGDHKTWGGFVGGVVVSVFSGFVLSKIYWPFEFSAVYWSFLLGIGALLGDALKSFSKRRAGIKSGRPWIPFDQVDYTIGALALGSFIFFPGWLYSLLIILLSALGHIAVNHIGFWLGVRDVKW